MNTNEPHPTSPRDGARPRAAQADLAIAIGSVAGSTHRRLGRPNQDAAAVVTTATATVIAVCDGCGSGRRSELGAAVGARLWTRALAEHATAPTDAELATAAAAVLAQLDVVADALGADRAEVTRECLLFTSVVAVITATEVVVAAIGDGVIVLGDQVVELGPFADNAPPYLTEAWFAAPRPLAIWRRTRADIDRVVIATDGALPLVASGSTALAELAATDSLYRNPVALERRLRLLADDRIEIDWAAHRTRRVPALLDDDTTAVMVRWGRS